MRDLLGDLEPAPPPEFEQFWALVINKRSKKTALRAWNKLHPVQRRRATEVYPNHVAYWRAEQRDISKIPYPATWLNAWAFDDELKARPVLHQSHQPAPLRESINRSEIPSDVRERMEKIRRRM